MEAYAFLSNKLKMMDKESLLQLGRKFTTGADVAQNYEYAFQAYQQAAILGNDRAIYKVGEAYFSGAGVPKDYEAAYYYMEKIKEKMLRANNFCRRHYADGKLRLQHRNEIMEPLFQEAQAGDATATFAIAENYFHGGAGYKDYETAVSWLQKEMLQDNPVAQFYLGYAYATGCGVKRDSRKGKAWFAKAAQRGFAPAIYNLAVCYTTGGGGLPDLKQAADLRKQAAEAGVKLDNQIGFYSPTALALDPKGWGWNEDDVL